MSRSSHASFLFHPRILRQQNPLEQEKGLEALGTAQCRLINRVDQNEMISQRNFLVGSSLLTVATLGAGALAAGVGEATLLARGITVGSELAGLGFVGQGLREKWARCARMAEGLRTTAGSGSARRYESVEAYAACEREFETEAILAALQVGGSASVVTAGASWQGAQRVLSKVGSNVRSLGLKLSTNTTKKIEGVVTRMLRSGRSEAAIESEVRGVLSACRAP